MVMNKQEWDKHVTPKLGTSDAMQRALDWWHELPIQNLIDINDSWVGYLWKYYPDKTHPYHLTGEKVQHIYDSEHVTNSTVIEKPTPEKYGWHEQCGFDDEPSGWLFEGGEEAYYEALKKWEAQQ